MNDLSIYKILVNKIADSIKTAR